MNIIHPVDGTPQEAAYPCLAQPKYDGVRAIWRDGCLQTVNGRPMPALSSLASAILSSRAPSAPADMILDGEIIGDAWADAVAAVSSASPLHGLRYVIWDALTTREALGLCPMPGYAARLARLRDWLSIPQQSSAVSICPGVLCASPSEAADAHAANLAAGFEGSVLKPLNRPGDWIRLKPIRTVDCVVVGSVPGTGRNAGRLGALIVLPLAHGVAVPKAQAPKPQPTRVGAGLSSTARAGLWQLRHRLYGRIVEVECAGVFPSGRLRFPVFRRWRPDKEN